MHRGLWIAMVTFYILGQLICNAVEDNSMLVNTDVTEVTTYSQTVSVDALGQISAVLGKAWSFIDKYILFDYTIFKTVDPGTGVATDSPLVIFKYILIGIFSIMIIDLFRVLRGN